MAKSDSAKSPSVAGDSPDKSLQQTAALSAIDFQALFESAPALFLVLTPELRIIAASDQYLAATMTRREDIVGQMLFDVFPDNPADEGATGASNLRYSLERVLRQRVADTMAVQKYDIRRPQDAGGGFEERYWSPTNSPVLGPDQQIKYIIHRVKDVTEYIKLKAKEHQYEHSKEGGRQRTEAMEIETYLQAQQLQSVNRQLQQANAALQAEVSERLAAEARSAALAQQLLSLNDELESRVRQRTDELAKTNHALQREMTERARAQERFRLVVEATPHAMVMVDTEGSIALVNRQTENFFGYGRDELLGQPVERLMPERFWDQHRRERREFLAEPVTRPMGAGRELFGRRNDGSEFPVEIGLNLIPTGEGAFVLSAIVDITHRKQAEEAQRQNELRFRAIFNQTFGFLGMLSTDGTILEVNQPALDFRNLSHADVVGKPLWEIPWFDISAETRGLAKQAVAAAAAGIFVRRELTVLDAQAKHRTFDFSIKPVRNDLGQVELLIPEARDITEQKLLEDQFRQAQKMEAVGKLAGGVAHDFNNLLTIILGYCEVLQDSLHHGDPLRELLDEIYNAGKRASRLTRQLLAFSRKQVLVPVVANINSLVAEMEKMLARLIGEDVELACRAADNLWSVRVDPGQIEQVVMNLAVNARDAMPRGGKLTIETANVELDETYVASHAEARAGQHVVLAVSDNGSGMDRATQDRIFEPFFSTKGEHGTGLGLATVYGIVKQSGGHITVYSEPGRGTSFKIYLPRVTGDDISASSKTGTGKSNLRGSETILLVEDEDGVRGLARMILQRYGYQVLEASNGGEALLLCERHSAPIHLLATDVVMPNMSGRELADRLSRLRPDLRVLYLSGYMDDAIVRHGLLNAGVPFLQKPYTPGALAGKVREILDGP